MACSKCGKPQEKGSLKLPYCIKCYNKEFKNDNEYFKKLKKV